MAESFKPALIVVDFQEDFCPPNGSLAVPSGRAIAPTINALLSLPFAIKVATRDWHPPNHISFAANHPNKTPFTSSVTIKDPVTPSAASSAHSYEITLWPTHCVQNTPGAALVPELDTSALDFVLDKGLDDRVEMYSAFYDPFKGSDSGLKERLRTEGVTDVFVVGLAADFCVKATAEHAADEGFRTVIIEEGTEPVMPDKWEECRRAIIDHGVKLVSMDGGEVNRVKNLQ